MVKIVGYKKKRNESGNKFLVLNLEGELTFNRSAETGAVFASALKTNVVANMSEDSCKALIGTEIPGCIKKIQTEPYQYVTPNGETKLLDYKFEFFPEEQEVVNAQPLEAAS
jgi:hypothetical protein